MNDSKPIRVLIVDDHAMVRSGLRDFLMVYDWVEQVGEAQNGVEAVDFCASHDVDVVLMDLVMPLMDGSEATRQILSLGKPIKVVVITSFHEQDLVQHAMNAGATGYLLKNVSADELAKAIQAAYAGFSTLAPEATRALIQSNHPKPTLGADLTKSERKILAALVKGMSNREISIQFSISVATVKYHLAHIFSKLGVRNRVEAASLALEHHLVEKNNSVIN
jgi:NarL family two-component system response regulator LiaR